MLSPGPVTVARPSRDKQWLLDLVASEPDLMLDEIRTRLRTKKKQRAGIGSNWRF